MSCVHVLQVAYYRRNAHTRARGYSSLPYSLLLSCCHYTTKATSTSYTGRGFQRMSYLAFANITELLGMPSLAAKYRTKANTISSAINKAFLNESSGAYATSPRFPENHRPGGTAEAAAHKASQAGQGMAFHSRFCAHQCCSRRVHVHTYSLAAFGAFEPPPTNAVSLVFQEVLLTLN